MKILILGATGMLGHTLFFVLGRLPQFYVWGSARALPADGMDFLHQAVNRGRLFSGVDAYDFESVKKVVMEVKPDVVINAIGLIRHLPEGNRPLPCIEINARFPHLLLDLCRRNRCRLIHYSTDCVFDGRKGSPYMESDPLSAKDVYGITKYLGELREAPALTVRTSIIGHELRGRHSLVEWFLGQDGPVSGYRRAIYTGLPVSEHARILTECILPNPDLAGLYQVASSPISKLNLLELIARQYDKKIEIIPDDEVREDKTMSGEAFFKTCRYTAPPWEELVSGMWALQRQMTLPIVQVDEP